MRFLGLIFAAALLAFGSAPAYAAKAPDGSYRESCRSVSASGDVLWARCTNARGRLVRVRLSNYSDCVGDISNQRGDLMCLRRRDLPGGDWSESCINPHLAEPGVFAAECKSLRGGWIESEIALDKCREGLTNARGHLGCFKKRVSDTPAPSPNAPRSTVPPAVAPAEEEPDEPAGPSLPPPTGPYQDSCRNLAFDGRYLSGECRDDRRRWQDTSLDAQSCARDQVIGNDDGDLVCTRRPGRQPPTGLYQKTCKDVTFDGRFVRADCKDMKGTWVRALLDMRPCKEGDEIVNEDAELICRAPAPPAPPPPSPGAAPPPAAMTAPTAPPSTLPRTATPAAPPAPAGATPPPAAPTTTQPPPTTPSTPPTPPTPPALPPAATSSITLYDGKGFEGATKTIGGDAADLAPLGWNDIASSLQVRGVWEVCEEVNFGGRCEQIVDDEPDLDDLGFNDRISSVRQVRDLSAPTPR